MSGSDILYTAEAQIVCPRCYARYDLAVTAKRAHRGPVYAGFVAGAIPFAFHAGWSSTTTVNGVVVSTSSRDVIAIACGAIALVCGGIALVGGIRARTQQQVVLAALVLALGGFQLARGFGVFDRVIEGHEATEIVAEPAPERPVDHPVARPAAAEPCPDQDACFALGEQRSAAKDTPGALAAFRRACELGSAGGCGNASNLVPDTEAVPLYERGCELGGPMPCANLGWALTEGKLVARDLDRARRVLTTSCDGGEGLGCRNLAVLYQDGLGVEVDAAKVIELLDQACEHGDAPACDALGVKLLKGLGANKNPRRAAALFTRACELSDDKCFDHGIALEQGLGGARRLDQARVAYDKACSADQYDACNNLAIMVDHGRGGPRDPAAARQLFDKACKGGVSDACRD